MLTSSWIGGFAVLSASCSGSAVAFVIPWTVDTAANSRRAALSLAFTFTAQPHQGQQPRRRRRRQQPGASSTGKRLGPNDTSLREVGVTRMAATDADRRREDSPTSSKDFTRGGGSTGQTANAPPASASAGQGGEATTAAAASGAEGLEWSQLGTECRKRVFVCTNRWCTEKGSSATLGSFVGLASEGDVLVQGVNCLGRCNKGPNLRVRQEDGNWLEFNRIDSVERVYKILRDYLGADVSKEAAICLKYNFLANGALDRNEVTQAIEYYDKAIATGYVDQQGVLLVMRATAFMQRAYSHGRALEDLVQKVMVDMPTQQTLEILRELWQASGPRARMMLLGMFALDCEGRGSLYQKTKFRYGLYEFALLRACEDALRATETLPTYPPCWLKAGDALACLLKPKEAAGYYQVALDLDPSMEVFLRPKIDALREGHAEGTLAAKLSF